MRMRMAAIFSKECHKERAEDVKGGHRRGEHADPVHPGGADERRRKNFVLAEKAGERRDAGDRYPCAHERQERNGRVLAKSAHVAQVLLSTERMDHTTRAQEQERLEERV